MLELQDICLMSLVKNYGIIGQNEFDSELTQAIQKLSQLTNIGLIGQDVARYMHIFQKTIPYAASRLM